MRSQCGAERFEDGDGGEDEAGDDRRRAEQIPDVFRDFRLAFHDQMYQTGICRTFSGSTPGWGQLQTIAPWPRVLFATVSRT